MASTQISMASFADEYTHIIKEAAFFQNAGVGLSALGRAAWKGGQGTSGLAKGKTGIGGAWEAAKGKATKMWQSPAGKDRLLAAGTAVGVPAVGLAGYGSR